MENTPQEEQQPQSTVEEKEVCESNLTKDDEEENCHQEKLTGYWMPPCGPCHKGKCCNKRDHFQHHGNFNFPVQQPIFGFFIPCERGPFCPQFGPCGPCRPPFGGPCGPCRPPFGPCGPCRPPFGPCGPCRPPFGPCGPCRPPFGPCGPCEEFHMKKHHKKGKRDHRPPFAPPFGMFGLCSSGPFGEDQFGPEGPCQRPPCPWGNHAKKPPPSSMGRKFIIIQ